MERIYNVSNRLPVTFKDGQITRSSGGLVAALEAFETGEQCELLWIGWPGGEVAEAERQREMRELLERDYCSVPVFLEGKEAEAHYDGFSNSSLWPILHYMPTYMRYEGAWWEAYESVNRRFAEEILRRVQSREMVWVHDYHLMLLPAMLKEARPSLRVGFFLHTPFPSYEVFRCHPRRSELLNGLLGADLVGFHTFGYARHFRSAVLRLLGIDSDITRIHHGGRTTTVGIYPIGINAKRFGAELDGEAFAERLAAMAAEYRGKRVILSVERLDYTKGLQRRLDAIDQFLARHEDRDHIKFIFVAVPSRESVGEYQTLRGEVEAIIGRLNGKYATIQNSPIHFIHGSVNFTELCALYALAEVAMVTPLIDGMNLVAKEYVACQRENPGSLILSEFAGSAEELFNALVVNPYDATNVAEALQQALEMPAEERSRRMMPMRQSVMTFDARVWAERFVGDLRSVTVPAEQTSPIEEAIEKMARAMAGGERVACFLDYDGTLREIERRPLAAVPTPEVRRVLELPESHPNMTMTIISGRSQEDLERWLGAYRVVIVAEHGASIRYPGQKEWEQQDVGVSHGWKEDVLKILQQFRLQTPGTMIEEKRSGLVWHYRNADPEFGAWRAKQLMDELAAMTANAPVQVRHGRKIVEVSAMQINKGAAVMSILQRSPAECVLVAGDDQTDETMFELSLPEVVTIKVGYGATHAKYRVANPAAFRALLERCAAGA